MFMRQIGSDLFWCRITQDLQATRTWRGPQVETNTPGVNEHFQKSGGVFLAALLQIISRLYSSSHRMQRRQRHTMRDFRLLGDGSGHPTCLRLSMETAHHLGARIKSHPCHNRCSQVGCRHTPQHFIIRACNILMLHGAKDRRRFCSMIPQKAWVL
jgi:hypothetical protein